MTDRSELLRREAELQAELESRKTTSQRQSDALRGNKPPQGGDVSHRQANALRGDSDE